MTVPITANKVTVYISQPQLFVSSEKELYVATITSPEFGSILKEGDTIQGRGAPGSVVYVAREGQLGVELTSKVTISTSENFSVIVKSGINLPSGQIGFRGVFHKETEFHSRRVTYEILGIPRITGPSGNQQQGFTVLGDNGLNGAAIKIYKSDDSSEELMGSGSVGANGNWTAKVDKPLPIGRVYLVAEQEKNSKKSGRSTRHTFVIPPNAPTIEVETNSQGVRLYGTGLADALLDIHRTGNPDREFFTDVGTGGTWEKYLPSELVPDSYSYAVKQSVPDESDRIYSAYSRNLPVQVPVPEPTQLTVSLQGQKPTFSGKGRRWVGFETVIRISGEFPIDGVEDALVKTNLEWDTTATKDFAPGTYSGLIARQHVNSRQSSFVNFGEFTIPSPQPVFTKPLELPGKNGQRPQIMGNAWPESAVTLTIPGKPPIPLTASGTGEFVLNATEDWNPGTYKISAVAEFGGQSSIEGEREFLVQTPRPTITTSGEVDMAPIIEGTGWAGGWVTIHKGDNQVLGAGPVDNQSRRFRVQLSQQSEGLLVIYATQAMENDRTNVSEETARVNLTVGVRAPVISDPGTRTTRTSIFSGTGATGGTVEFYLDGADDPFVEGIPVEEGHWETTLLLPAGSPRLEVALRHSGGRSPKQLHPITVVPDRPIVDTPLPGEALGDVLHISGFGFPGDDIRINTRPNQKLMGWSKVTDAGTWTASVKNILDDTEKNIVTLAMAGPDLGSQYSPQLATTPLLKELPQFTEPLPHDQVGLRPLYAGLATPGATIQVASWFNTEHLLAPSTEADEFGRWQVVGDKDLPEGATRVAVRQTVGGVHSQWVESGRFLVEKIPDKETLGPPVVDLPSRGQKVGRYPMFQGWGVPGATITVVKRGSSSTKLVENCRVDRNGGWAARSVLELPVGDNYEYSANQRRDGITSDWALPIRAMDVIEVQEGFDAPVIDTPENSSPNLEPRPVFAGTGMPGAEVRVWINGLGEARHVTARVDAHGRWTGRSDRDIAVGSVTVHAFQFVDKDGEEVQSARSRDVQFTVDARIAPPVILSPANDAEVPPRAVLRGTALPLSQVQLYQRGHGTVLLASSFVDNEGNWTMVIPPWPFGLFQISVRAVLAPLLPTNNWAQLDVTVIDTD
ncbi:hypothetical protein ACLK1G_10005 [Pseudomonas sp. NR3]|uniref:hypothetical protein n=1 Tax=Pseudomonas sp. NR3 TaxID=3155978 RepID=UPI003B67423A